MCTAPQAPCSLLQCTVLQSCVLRSSAVRRNPPSRAPAAVAAAQVMEVHLRDREAELRLSLGPDFVAAFKAARDWRNKWSPRAG